MRCSSNGETTKLYFTVGVKADVLCKLANTTEMDISLSTDGIMHVGDSGVIESTDS